MPIYKGTTNLSLAKGTIPISSVYKGTTLVYSSYTWEQWYQTFLYNALIPQTINSKNVLNQAKVVKVESNGVIENQLNDHDTRNYTNDNPNIYTSTKTLTGVDLVCTTAGSATNKILTNIDLVVGHKYIVAYDILSTLSFSLDTSSTITGNNIVYNVLSITANQQTKVITLFDAVGGTTVWRIARGSTNWTVGATMNITNIMIFDLTLMFGTGNEPTTLTDTRIQALLNRGYIAYNTGTYKGIDIGVISTKDSNNADLDTLTFKYQGNGAINTHDTFEITNSGYVFTRNVGSYTFNGTETFNAGTGGYGWAMFNFVQNNGAKPNTSNNLIPDFNCNKYANATPQNITSSSVDKAISYNVSGSLLIRDTSITTAADMSTAMSGAKIIYPLATPQTITIPKKHLGVVDLGSLSWQKESYTYNGQSYYRFKVQVQGIKIATSSSTLYNVYCSKYITDTAGHSFLQTSDKIIALDTNSFIVANDSSYTSATDFKTAMSGVYLFYETEDEVADIDTKIGIESGGTITTDSEVLPNIEFGLKAK